MRELPRPDRREAAKGEWRLYEKFIDASIWEASTHSAKLSVVKRKTTATITMDINRAGPPIPATMPVTTRRRFRLDDGLNTNGCSI